MEIKRIIEEYHEQLYAHKFNSLDEMDLILERHSLPKLTQEEIHNLKRPMFSKEIKSIICNLPKQKVPSPDGFTGDFYQTCKEEIIVILYNHFQKIETERICPNYSYETNTMLIPKEARHYKKRI